MERSVIDTFDLLRTECEPVFLMPRINLRKPTPVFRAVQSKGFSYRFFSDYWEWPLLGKPRSMVHLCRLLSSVLLANLDVLRHSAGARFLYLPGWTAAVYSLLGAASFRLFGKRVIFSFHDLMLEASHKAALPVQLSSDIVHCAYYSYEAVRKRNPQIESRRNRVIPPAIELRLDSHEIPPSPRMVQRVVFMGRVSLDKGIDLLAKAFKEVVASCPQAELQIIGHCDSAFESQFQDLIRGCERISVLGYLEKSHALLAEAYLYVQPTPPSRSHESFGRGAVEAMACGIPVISFGSGALQEIVRDGVNGLMCKEESVKCLAEQLHRLLTDVNLRNKLAAGARLSYEQHYSNDAVKQAWCSLLQADPA